jgi:type I restriction enzyme S subunit
LIERFFYLDVPNLRFPGFEGGWEEKKLLDVAPLQRGFDLPINDIKKGNFPVVFSNGILKFHNEFKIKAPGVVTGRSGTIGKVTFVEKDYWPHNTSLWVTDFKNNVPKFIYHFYSRYKLERFGTGSGVPTLNRNDIHIQKEYFPKSDEQQKIASFLSLIDERIATQNKIIEELKLLKNTLSKEVISEQLKFRNNSRSGFSEWKIEKLGNLSTITTGTSNREDSILNGEYTFFDRSQDIRASNKYLFDKEAIIVPGEGQELFLNIIRENLICINGLMRFLTLII